MKTLLRQIHHSQIQADGVASFAFRPSKNHEGLLSTYCGNTFTPESSYNHYTKSGLSSSGVLGVTTQECESFDLPTIDDNYGFDGHVSIDFRKFSRKDVETKSKDLRNKALQRGWLYQPEQDESTQHS